MIRTYPNRQQAVEAWRTVTGPAVMREWDGRWFIADRPEDFMGHPSTPHKPSLRSAA